MKSGSRISPVSNASLSVPQREKQLRIPLVTIDPGLSGTGVALFTAKGHLSDWIVLTTHKSEKRLPWWIRAFNLADDVEQVLSTVWKMEESFEVVSEFPMKMESMAGIAAQKYSTARLAFLVGATGMLLTASFPGTKFSVVTPQEWKGQLPKKIVEHRIRQRLGSAVTGVQSHAWDAIGIGLWRLGKL